MEKLWFDVQSNLYNIELQMLKLLVEKHVFINQNIYKVYNFFT